MQLLLVYSAKKNNSACQKPPQRYEAWFFIQRITGVVASITPNVAIPKKSLVLSGFCGFDLPWPAPMALRWFRGIHDLDLLLSIAALIQAPTISGLHKGSIDQPKNSSDFANVNWFIDVYRRNHWVLKPRAASQARIMSFIRSFGLFGHPFFDQHFKTFISSLSWR